MSKDMKMVHMTLQDQPAGTKFWLDEAKTQAVMKTSFQVTLPGQCTPNYTKVWLVSLDTGSLFEYDADVCIESVKGQFVADKEI